MTTSTPTQPPTRIRLRASAGLVFLVQVAGAGLSYLMHVVLARTMTTAGYGTFAYVVGWAVVLATLTSLGLPGTALRFIRLLLGRRETEGALALWRWGGRRLAGSITLVAALGAVAGGAVAAVGHPGTGALVAGGAALVAALATTEWASAVARSIERPLLAFAPQLLGRPVLALGVLLTLATAGTVSAPAGVTVFAGAAAVAALVQLAVTRAGVRRLGSGVPESLVPDPEAAPGSSAEVLGPAAWRGVALGLWAFSALALALNRSNLILLGALRGPEEVALYNAAAKTAGLAAFVLMAVNAVIAPRFGALHDLGARAELQALLRRAMGWIVWPTLMIVVVLIAAAPWILSLFGPAYRGATLLLAVLALGSLVNALSGPVGLLLNTTGHQREATRIFAWSLGFNLLVGVPLILFVGALGAAVADALTLVLWNLWMAALVRRRIGVEATVLQMVERRRDTRR